MVQQSLTRYHGGKKRIAPWLISLMPPHKCYVEPFGGGASVLLSKSPCKTEVYNDIDADIFNLFKTVRENGDELKEQLNLTVFSRDELNLCYESNDSLSNIEKARRFLVKSHMAMSTTAFYVNSGFRGTINSGDYCSIPNTFYKLAELIPKIRERLRYTIIENTDVFKILARYNLPQTLWYLDPPYVDSTRSSSSQKRGYAHNFSDDQHERLLGIALKLDGYVMISGYENDLYNDTLIGWTKSSVQARSDRGAKRVETVWMNFNQSTLF